MSLHMKRKATQCTHPSSPRKKESTSLQKKGPNQVGISTFYCFALALSLEQEDYKCLFIQSFQQKHVWKKKKKGRGLAVVCSRVAKEDAINQTKWHPILIQLLVLYYTKLICALKKHAD